MDALNNQLDRLGVDKITLCLSLFSVFFIATFIFYDAEFAKRTIDLTKSSCKGKVVSILEGGYDLNALKESVNFHVKSLLEN